jgi:uncharacterized paraquat-inducible protein A
MGIRITAQKRDRMTDCACPRSSKITKPERDAPKAAYILMAASVSVLLVVAVFSLWIALIIGSIIAAFSLLSICWRLIRGHGLRCALLWGPTSVMTKLIEGVFYTTAS